MRIAISGQSGCGNTTAVTNVSRTLLLQTMNYTFRDLARDLELEFDFVHKQALVDPIYDFLTDMTLIRAAITDKIVVGTRLAAWLVEADLRIWLHAPLEERARRISRREREKGHSYEEVLYKTLRRDAENRARYLQLYGIDLNDHSDFDITINTANLTAEQVSSLMVSAAEWAKENRLERHNLHLPRIRKIICDYLHLPPEALTDPSYQIHLKEIWAKAQKKS